MSVETKRVSHIKCDSCEAECHGDHVDGLFSTIKAERSAYMEAVRRRWELRDSIDLCPKCSGLKHQQQDKQ